MNRLRIFSNRIIINKCNVLNTKINSHSNQTPPSYYVFDRNTKKMQRNRIANESDGGWLKEEIGSRVADRIYDIKRSFNTIVDLGCQRGYVSKHLTKVHIYHNFRKLKKNQMFEMFLIINFFIKGYCEKNSHA